MFAAQLVCLAVRTISMVCAHDWAMHSGNSEPQPRRRAWGVLCGRLRTIGRGP